METEVITTWLLMAPWYQGNQDQVQLRLPWAHSQALYLIMLTACQQRQRHLKTLNCRKKVTEGLVDTAVSIMHIQLF